MSATCKVIWKSSSLQVVDIDCEAVARAIMYFVDIGDAVCVTISRYVCEVISIRIKGKALTGYKMLINSCSIFGLRFQSWIS